MRAEISRRGTVWFALAILVLVAAGCGGGGDDEPEESSFTLPRTYEQLDLSTPDGAVAEFISAFERRDYATAALVLHRDTQAAMAGAVTAGDLSGFVTADAEASLRARITVEREGDHELGAGRLFEVAMEEAMANGGFRVDLASGVDGLTVRSSDQFTAIVEGILATNGSDVTFELAPATDGRWRIRNVRLANGTPLQVPFSGEPTVGSTPRRTEPTDVWRSSLPAGDPQQLLETVRDLVRVGDHVSLFLLLDAPAQRAAIDQLATYAPADHALPAAVLDAWLDSVGFPFDADEMGDVPSTFMESAENVGIGEGLTFMVEVDDGGLDVTMSRDSTGGWRLHRMVPVGDLAAPAPFALS